MYASSSVGNDEAFNLQPTLANLPNRYCSAFDVFITKLFVLRKFIPSLNGLRAASIVLVILHHLDLSGHFAALSAQNRIFRFILPFISDGALGVNVFFVISGFLITTLLIAEQASTHTISLKGFYLRRSLRIFPAYYFFLFVYFILQKFNILQFNHTTWLTTLTYTTQFYPATPVEAGHLWSLSAEEVFYLFWPLLFILLKKRSDIFIYSLLLIIIISRVVFFAFPAPTLTNTIFTRGDAMLIGCLVATNYLKITAWVIKTRKWHPLLYVLLFLSIWINNNLYHSYSINTGSNKLFTLLNLSNTLIGHIGIVTNILIALLMVRVINIKGPEYYILNSSPFNYIGMLSYSIYLWQQIFGSDNIYFRQLPVFVSLACIFAAACFSYYLIERPFLSLKAKLEQPRPGIFRRRSRMLPAQNNG